MSTEKNTNRYSNEELEEFKAAVDQKLEKANEALQFILDQIKALTDAGSEGDYMDDTSNTNDLKMLYTMEERHAKHINDLQNALLRIKNKSYGICIATGQLIDKKRLLAVPTTTKSLEAKLIEADPLRKLKRPEPSKKKKESKPQSIVKIKKKKKDIKEVKPEPEDELNIDDELNDDFDDTFLENDDFLGEDIDLDLEMDEEI
ncbi:MAG: hypothetical protein DWQ02_03285 [Bacteroidetes bacterium]|nr:MAG: hypothetical protein DWQ02_03285 [Bacteroidota bacterium]